jgi:hypothetical protein
MMALVARAIVTRPALVRKWCESPPPCPSPSALHTTFTPLAQCCSVISRAVSRPPRAWHAVRRPAKTPLFLRAGEGIRTLDVDLGKRAQSRFQALRIVKYTEKKPQLALPGPSTRYA